MSSEGWELLVAWTQGQGLTNEIETQRLLREGKANPSDRERVLARAASLGTAMGSLFRAVAEQSPPPPADLARLNLEMAALFSTSRLEPAGAVYRWAWAREPLERILYPILRSACDLLTSSELSHVRICEAETCNWVFLDTTKNRSRRWCDMRSCGNREKMKRYRLRKRRSA